jgi:tyrosyl-tRNA synthetase
MSDIISELTWRGAIFDQTEEVPTLLSSQKITLYNGFDPTGDSLHVGHLVPMIGLARFQRYGHTPIAVAGGGTGMIGDPSGRSDERNLLTREQIEANLEGIKPQLARFLDFEVKSNPARIINNADWLSQLSLLDFLRDVGKQFTVNVMLSKDSVKSRMDRGISFTEFSYMLLQAYDFWHLYQQENCVLQTGGSDQWGNILAGTDLIRREGGKGHGLVYPLITKADGAKFGKTAAGAVWLDAKKTSPYRFYQFWLSSDDRDVVNYLKLFTWLTQDEVADLADKHEASPHLREAHTTLAQEMTRLVHGEGALQRAEQATAVLFGGSFDGLTSDDIADIFSEVPTSELPRHELANEMNVVDLIATTSLVNGKGDAKRAIQGGGLYLNNNRLENGGQTITLADSLEGKFVVLRKGKKQYHLVKLV